MTQNLSEIRKFLLAGLAIFTLTSKITKERRTFRVRAAEDVTGEGKPHGWYVDLLTGPNNVTDYRYLLYLHIDRFDELEVKINHGRWGEEAYRAFGWLTLQIDRFMSGGEFDMHVQRHFERQAEFAHAGLCGRCGRRLTDPESIDLGIGPVCRDKS